MDNSRICSQSYTVSVTDTWEYKTVTFPADTTGVFGADTGGSLWVDFWMRAGTTFSSGTLATTWAGEVNANRAVGQVDALDTLNDAVQITGVQLEVGSTATPFEYKGIGQEIADCRRYYEKSYNIGPAPGTANQEKGVQSIFTSDGMTNGVSTRFGGTHYSVEKRGNPTVTIYSREGTSGAISNASLTTLAADSGIATWIGSSGFIMQMNAASSISPANGGYVWHWVADAEL